MEVRNADIRMSVPPRNPTCQPEMSGFLTSSSWPLTMVSAESEGRVDEQLELEERPTPLAGDDGDRSGGRERAPAAQAARMDPGSIAPTIGADGRKALTTDRGRPREGEALDRGVRACGPRSCPRDSATPPVVSTCRDRDHRRR